MNKLGRLYVAMIGSTLPLMVSSDEIGEIQWHGYLTSAVMVTTDGGDAHYSGDINDDGSVQDTRLGLALSTQVDEDWRFAAQMKALGREKFNMELDWAYASYDVSDNTVLRFGKIKYPIGLYNEFVDIGYTYSWIRPPESFYNQDVVGPNITRVSYNGMGATFTTYGKRSETSLDLFTGVVDVPVGRVNQLVGTKISFNMEDAFRFEIGGNTGVMEIQEDDFPFVFGMMEGERHTTYTAGLAVDMAHLMFTIEAAKATMGPSMMDTTSGYTMLGYRMAGYTPHITWGKWEVDGGWGQEVLGVGLRKELTTNSALKFEVRQITPDDIEKPDPTFKKPNPGSMPPSGPMSPPGSGLGLFDGVPDEKDVIMYGVALEMVF
jgi:hypothetical protein